MDERRHRPPVPAQTPFARRAIERLLGPLVFKRRLPHTAGAAPLIVSARVGGLKYLFRRSGQWDPQLLRITNLLVEHGSCVWDVGANVGLFAGAAAYRAGANGLVLAMEADFDAVALLNRTRRLTPSGHAPITVLPTAVSAEAGFVTFNIAKRARAANSIDGFGTTQTGGVQESRTLPCVTLDGLLKHFRAPDVLKIDVEGAELEVLNGSQHLISKVRPKIYCEVQRDTWAQAVVLLQQYKYRLWNGDVFTGRIDDPPASDTTNNLLAIPEECMDEVLQRHA